MRFPLIYGRDSHRYDFGRPHPLNAQRLELAADLMRALGLLDGPDAGLVPPRMASDDEIAMLHGRDYIAAVKAAGEFGEQAPIALRYGIGPGDNPPFPHMHEAAAYIAGGSLAGAGAVAGGQVEHAFHFPGGLHHAMRSRAGGFCIYNDVALACEAFRRRGQRVLYVDVDAHHGDGTQALFYDIPEVLTISLHESGEYLFPGTGFTWETGEGRGAGYAVNVPFEPGTDDASWIECFETVVPPIARAYRPDVIVSQHGCDTHRLDPLTHMECSVAVAEHAARRIHDLAHDLCSGRWLATGGGGYDVWRVVPRAWSHVFAVLSHRELPEDVPEEWIARWAGEAPVGLPRSMRDQPTAHASESIRARNRDAAARARDQALAAVESGKG